MLNQKTPTMLCFIVAIWMLLEPFTALAAEPTIRHDYYAKAWGIEHGLSQGTIPCMLQTPDGYIWMGTQESLSRFDGVRFINYTTKNTPVLKSSWIQSMALSQDKHLIIGTWRGGIYEEIDGEFHPLNRNNDHAFDTAIVNSIAVAPDGTIWAGTTEGLFSLKNGLIKPVGPAKQTRFETVRSLIFTQDGTLWIGTQDQGLWTLRGGQYKQYTATDGLSSNMIWALAEAGPDSVWIGSDHILIHSNGREFSAYPVPVTILPNHITAITRAQDGTIWLGMQNEGLWRYADGMFSQADGLGSDLTLSVMEDREHNVWVGSNGTGVTQFVRNRIRVISHEEGLAVKEIWTIMEAQDNSLWIGSHGGGLNRIQDGHITRYTLKDGLSSLLITALHQSPTDGSIWVGTEDNGIIRIKDGEFSRFRLGPSLSENIVYAINQQTDGVMLIGTAAGLAIWQDGRVVKRLTTQDGLSHNFVRELVATPVKNEFWVATDVGLNLIRNGQIIKAYHKHDGLPEEALNGLYLDKQNHLWISTYGSGIIHFHDGRFTSIDSASGLHNDVVYDILEDEQGRFWMSSNRGIFAVKKSDLLDFVEGKTKKISCFPLGIGDGLKALECNGGRQPSAWLTRSGLACFATINGVAMLDTHGFKLDEPAPTPIFEQVRVNNLIHPMSDQISIKPGKRNLDIDFTVPYFSAPEKIRFRYRLFPFEDEWQDSHGLRSAHYTNIPHGDYRFELQCSNRFSLWNTSGKPAGLTLQFHPFFYETWWFRILVFSLFLAFIAFLLHHRVESLKKSKRQLEQAVEERTKELKEAYAQMEQLSLTDTLTTLFNRRYFHNIIDREVSMVIRQYTRPSTQSDAFATGFLMIDIDHFKLINDQYGHLSGDHFLQMISRRFQETLRTSDLIVRWGGEEFLVLSKENNFEGARLLCNRLLSAINQTPFILDDHTITGSISIGFCPFPVFPERPKLFTWEDTVNLADQALYQAKKSGRNCAVGVRLNSYQLNENQIKTIREDFTGAIEQKLLQVVYERS